MRTGIPILSISLLLLSSCVQNHKEGEALVLNVPFSSFAQSEDSFLATGISVNSIMLSDGGRQECIQSSVSKVLCTEDRILVLDGIQNSLVAYDQNGQAIAKIGVRGRGPQEYVQISDFTITEDQEIVLLDGNKNELIYFDKEYRFSRKKKSQHEISRLVSVGDGQFLMNLSTWDPSGAGDCKVLLCDENQKEIARYIKDDNPNDPNFEFPYVGFFPSDGDNIFFLKPIDDNVYVFSGNRLETIYHFDFGPKTVKKDYRSEIEKNMADIMNSTFLVNTVWVSGQHCLGMLFNKGEFITFYADIERKILTDITEMGYFMGVSDGRAFFYQMDAPESDGAPVLNMFNTGEFAD